MTQLVAAVRPVTDQSTLLVSKLVSETLTGESAPATVNTMAFSQETFITGVRADHGGQVILTGNQVIEGTSNTQAILYKGPMQSFLICRCV